MRARTLVAPLLLAPLLLGPLSCGLSAEVEIQRFCITQHVASLPPMPPGGGSVSVPAFPLPVQVPPLLRKDGAHVTLRLLDARLAPTTPGTDLAGIASLDISAQPASGTPVLLASYDRPTPAPASVPAIALAGRGVDVVSLLEGDNLQIAIDASASGQPPSAAWDADLQVCFYGKTVFPYL
jgi:hypothetical protein